MNLFFGLERGASLLPDSGGGQGRRVQCRTYQRRVRPDLTESVYKVVWQKSIPARIRQLILYISKNKGYVNSFVGELTFSNQLTNTLVEISPDRSRSRLWFRTRR